ncbi:hypothetical protein BU17DRAFT_80467 [Hysterangium stoloniferum]|nr:hypothetical protein BU17DRAFT_80467 [Hysterangium stoloniferum]
MSTSYRTYSQSSRSPSVSPHGSDYGQYATGSGQGQPSYYYPAQGGSRTSSDSIPRAATYTPRSADSERAAKRQRGMTGHSGADTQPRWAEGGPRYLPTGHGVHGYPSAGYTYSQSGSVSPPVHSDRGTPSSSRHHQPSTVSSRTPSPPESQDEPLDHGPTELPPRTYTGQSKYNPPKKPGKIPGSAMDYLPILEARFERLETAIDRYVDYRGQRALSNSILPGSDVPHQSSSRRRTDGSTR